ncbi:uncharacterized protein LOC108669580 [Hyalella azteca]|uniref:Uncharacterized protein LOC108669580 n=1 Tax=Hyalella azteca TaxID=294128 RepID=A0A8B7NFQ7_HYAAZ|nr:uncharacterized protein LOC108669580 [Hyalella azteca]
MSYETSDLQHRHETSVAALDKRLIPSKGKLSSDLQERLLPIPKQEENVDGYACHRIRPLFKPDHSVDENLIQKLRDASLSVNINKLPSDQVRQFPLNVVNTFSCLRKSSNDDGKPMDCSSDSERNLSSKSCVRSQANAVSENLRSSASTSRGATTAASKTDAEVAWGEASKCINGNPMTGSGLFGIVQEACAKHNVKWPVECQVVGPAIQHLVDWPLYPEPFYRASGSELRPQPVGDETGRVVYNYNPTSAVNYFSRSCVGGNKHVSDEVRPPLTSEADSTLQFESRFESGNLAKVIQVSECYYELHLRSDLYTARHTQWYYFAVSNTRRKMTYRFSIVNLMKCDSLYNHGLRPLLYSEKEAQLHGVGWRRCASNIVYFRNQDKYDPSCLDSDDDDAEEEAASYTLTFNVTFPHDHDTVYLAHCYPYTFSLLQQHLLAIQNDPARASVCKQRVMCRTLAGNPVTLLTITSNHPEDEGKKKRAIVLTARVHPGETPASWIMKGALDFLTSDNPRAVDLRRQFVFKIVPMINPDGVIVGNHRCSLAARDLNRQYKMVVKEMFPSIWNIKAMVRKLMDEHGVVMFCDFHAHSRKHNTFLYGCENRRSHENHLREQIFPLLLHYNAGDKFSFRGCKFRIHRSKEGTARIVVWMMGVLHSYTLEASFGGATHGTRAHTHFTLHDFTTLGLQFCETLHTYFDPLPVKEKLRHKLWARLVKKGSNADEPTAVDLSDSNSSSDDSDKPPTSSSAAAGRAKKKKAAASSSSNAAKTSARKRAGMKGSNSAVDKLSRNSKMDKQCLSPGQYDDAGIGTSLGHHLSYSSSSDVPKTYIYDPTTLTLVRRSLNRRSTGSLDLPDHQSSVDQRNFLSRELLSEECVSDALVKPRSNSLRVRKGKTGKKSRPASSRNLPPKTDGSLRDETSSPRISSANAASPSQFKDSSAVRIHRGLESPNHRGLESPNHRGLESPNHRGLESPTHRGLESPTLIINQSPSLSRRTAVTPALIQPTDLPFSPENMGATGGTEFSRATQAKTYMERMSEMNARLAVSDQEDENVRFWDFDSCHDSPRCSGVVNKILSSPRSSSLRMCGDAETLGPVVGKNLFSDLQKSVYHPSRRTLVSTTKSPRRALHRSLTNLHPSSTSHVTRLHSPPVLPLSTYTSQSRLDVKPRSNFRSQFATHDNGHPENYSNSTLHVKIDSEIEPTNSWLPSVLHDKVETYKAPAYFKSDFIANKIDIPVYYSTGNLLNLDYVDPNAIANRRINRLIESSGCASHPGNESSSSDSGYRSKRSQQQKNKKISHKFSEEAINSARKDDDGQLCPEIETGDTLFLDIRAKEPPELLAVKNLKEKVKKKKSSKEKLFAIDAGIGGPTDRGDSMEPSSALRPLNDVSVSVEKVDQSDEATVKIRKKIKIVIGKKPKLKIVRRKSLIDSGT